MTDKHKWQFQARFRRHAFGWRSRLPIQRIREAVSEIKKVARKDKVLAAEGAIRFLERISPAIEQVDSSSGSIGTAVNRSIDALVPIIAGAPADAKLRDKWLERLWAAYQDDGMPYIEQLGELWGELCASVELASLWADRLLPGVQHANDESPETYVFFKGKTNCLSALLRAERYEEILEVLAAKPNQIWSYSLFGVRALVLLGRQADALRYAEEHHGGGSNSISLAHTCEGILLSSGFAEEAYRRYGLVANEAQTYLAWFRNVVRKYPHKEPAEILKDLVESTPTERGKWFAAAKDAKLYGEAIELVRYSPCEPKTLTRAARDFAQKHPVFGMEAGLAALNWFASGYGYEVILADARDAFTYTMQAAENCDRKEEAIRRLQKMLGRERRDEDFIKRGVRRMVAES